MTATKRWVALLVAVLAITAGCTGAGNGGDSAGEPLANEDVEFAGEADQATPMATSTPVAEPDARDSDGGDGAQQAVGEYNAQRFADRQLILTGRVVVEVDDFATARSNLTEATEAYGGYVSDTSQEIHRVENETWTEGVVVLRVPRENFSALFDRAEAEGELRHSEQDSQDVTDQLVDIQARLDNLRAERDQLRELYQRANDTEDVLRVQERLSDVQGEIERLEARQQALRERVAMSTITVRLSEPRPEPDRPAPEEWYDVPIVAAFLESVTGVVVTLRALAVAGAYALPYVLAFGIPLAIVGYAARRRRPFGGWRGRRGGEVTESSASDAAQDQEGPAENDDAETDEDDG